MKFIVYTIAAAIFLTTLPGLYATNPGNDLKIVSLNGSISEILVDLGLENNIVGVDATSTYPKSLLKEKNNLGHRQNISIEGILSLSPSIVLTTENTLTDRSINQLKSTNIKIIVFKQEFSINGTKNLIKEVAKSLDKEEKAKPIIDKLDRDLEHAKKYISKGNKSKVLFIYARGLGTLLVAGKNTQVDKIISLAGGVNAITNFDNFKPLTPESLINANPDIILLFDSGFRSLGGETGLLKIQGIMQTNAGKNKKFIEMDGQLLTGFGPRLGQAIWQLARQIK